MDNAIEEPENFTRIFDEWYHTPTNYNEHNVRWSNTICDMIVPQRTTMAGWAIIFPCIWLLLEGLLGKKRKSFIVLGCIAACMPMIHTHSFLALGLISAGAFFIFFFNNKTKEERISYIINWAIYGGIVAVFAFPQLFYWTFSQTSGNQSFLQYHFNWVNGWKESYIWFYVKNWGIIALLIIPAFFNADKETKKVFLSCLPLFIISELIVFQPNEYDNNKLFYIVYFRDVIIVCGFVTNMWKTLKESKCRVYFLILFIFLGTFSGILTIAREIKSGNEFLTFNNGMIEVADFIKENTPKDAVFLTGTGHINPVASLAGRNIYLGASVYVYFHGYKEEYYDRLDKTKEAYHATYDELIEFCEDNGISYIYIGKDEKNDFEINYETMDKLSKEYDDGINQVYKVI
jgi:hypothetical protein